MHQVKESLHCVLDLLQILLLLSTPLNTVKLIGYLVIELEKHPKYSYMLFLKSK